MVESPIFHPQCGMDCVSFVRVIMDDPRKLSREPCPAGTSPSQILVSLDVTLGVLWERIVFPLYICICGSVGKW